MLRKLNFGFIRVVLLFILLFDQDIFSCTMKRSYLKPTNYELVRETQVIVLAQSIGFEKEKCIAKFKLLKTIKGEFKEGAFSLSTCNEFFGENPLDENDFSNARPSRGVCVADGYRKDRMYVLFLSKVNDQWKIHWRAFSRVNEEVLHSNSPWVIAVSRYAEVAALDNYELEKNELSKILNSSASQANSGENTYALISDIKNHFRQPTNYKSYLDLKHIYDESSNEEIRSRVRFAWVNRKDLEAKEVFWKQLESADLSRNSLASAYMAATDQKDAIDPLKQIFLKRSISDNRRSLLSALVSLADERHIDLMLEIFDACRDDEAGYIAMWFSKYPVERVMQRLNARVDGKYMGRYEIAYALAAAGDEAVVDWAGVYVKQNYSLPWMAAHILAISPIKRADEFVEHLIKKQRSLELVMVVGGYADSENPYRLERLRQIVLSYPMDKDFRYRVYQTLLKIERDKSVDVKDLLVAITAEGVPTLKDE